MLSRQNQSFFFFTILMIVQLQLRIDAKKYDVLLERIELVDKNPKYIGFWELYTRRQSRYSPYAIFANVSVIQPFYNNGSAHITVYEKVNSEYKLTPLQIKFLVCDWLKRDKLIIPIIRKYNNNSFNDCPMYGNIVVQNLTVVSEDAPTGFWPFERNRVDFHFFVTSTKEMIVKFLIYVSIVERPEKKAKSRHMLNREYV